VAVIQGWQVEWDQINVTVGGITVTRNRGEVLPVTSDPAELAQRAQLVTGGALRLVQVAATQADAGAVVTADADALLAQQLSAHQAETGQPEPAGAAPQPEVDTGAGAVVDEG
jgi:hypothetical protein